MKTTASWVAEAVATLALGDRVRRLDGAERSDVLSRVIQAFLERPGLFWWEHLKSPTESWNMEHGFKMLPQLAPDPEARCWLITGLEDTADEMGVFECPPALAPAVIGECPGFEYALVDQELKWLVIENHSDVLVATGEAGERLSRLRG